MRELIFRDYMRTHKKERDEYAEIKKVLSKEFPYDIDGYMAQLMPDHYHSIQIMLDYENKKMVTLGDITPNWWI